MYVYNMSDYAEMCEEPCLVWGHHIWAKVQVPAAQDSPELGTPCQSSIQLATKTPRARVLAKSANLECMRCVDSKLAVFAKALRGSRSKNTVCSPTIIQI
jgi:hypothetical protein